MTETIATPCVDLAVLKQFNSASSDYTFYPAPTRFIEAFGTVEYASWLKKRGIGGFGRTLALYVHSPCSDTNRFPHGRHGDVRKSRAAWSRYLEYLKKEARLLSSLLDGRSLVHIHWGVDLSACLDVAQLRDLDQALARDFDESEQTGHSIDVDAHRVAGDTISVLADLGFKRITFGIANFEAYDPTELDRTHIDATTEDAIETARACGFNSINIDLFYGLPEQTVMSFNRALKKVIALSPERIAVHSYAHLPRVSGLRGKTGELNVPELDTRIQQFSLAVMRLSEAGYVHVGMDLFAKPDDDLAIAQRRGRLHLHCQGYLTQPDCDLLGLGVSSFSMVGPAYSQNARTLEEYRERLDNDILPVVRGIELTADDLARRTVMHALLCHFEVAFESVEIAYFLDFRKYFCEELEELSEFVDAGLVQIDDNWLSVTDRGHYVVQAVCRVFDRYLREGRERASFSKVL